MPGIFRRLFDGLTVWKAAKHLILYTLGISILTYAVAKHWNGKVGANGQVFPGIKDLFQAGADATTLFGVVVIVTGMIFFQALRLTVVLRAMGVAAPLGVVLRYGIIGAFFNIFMPGSVGGDAIKVLCLIRVYPKQQVRVISSVLIDRGIGVFGLFLVMSVIGVGGWLGVGPAPKFPDLGQYLTGCVVLTAVAAAAFAGFCLARRSPPATTTVAAPTPADAPPTDAPVAPESKRSDALREFKAVIACCRRNPRAVATGLVIALAVHALFITEFHLATRVFMPPNPNQVGSFEQHLLIAPMGCTIQAFSPTPSGVGVAEWVFGMLYAKLDKPDVIGVNGRVVMRLVEAGYGTLLCLVVVAFTRRPTPVLVPVPAG